MEGIDNLSTRTILQSGPTRTRKGADLDAALSVLIDAGRVRVEKIGKRRQVRINPALLDASGEAIAEADAPDLAPIDAAPAQGWN